MSRPAALDSPDSLPAPNLDALKSHMQELARLVEDVEASIGSELEGLPTLKDSTLQNLQRVDFLRQSLMDLCVAFQFVCEIEVYSQSILMKDLKLESTKLIFGTSFNGVNESSQGAVDLF